MDDFLDQRFIGNKYFGADGDHWSQILGKILAPQCKFYRTADERTLFEDLHHALIDSAQLMPELTLYNFEGLTPHYQNPKIPPERVCFSARSTYNQTCE
jgi:hypothetical protein